MSSTNMRRFFLLCALFSNSAFSQQHLPVSTTVTAVPVKVQPISLRPADAPYPKELSSIGVQGTAEVLASFDADGKPLSASIAQTSRSEKLDLAAIALVKSLTYKLVEKKVSQTEVLIPVEFLRDSVANLHQKSCKEFNIDLEYFKSTFPEKKPQDMSVINMSIGYLALVGKPTIEKQIALAKSIKDIVPMTVSSCASQPDAKYFEVFKQLVNEFSSKSGS